MKENVPTCLPVLDLPDFFLKERFAKDFYNYHPVPQDNFPLANDFCYDWHWAFHKTANRSFDIVSSFLRIAILS